MSNQRLFNKRQKKILKLREGNRCKACGVPLVASFQADHVIPYSRGGKTVLLNGQALCAPCNLKKGNMMPEMDLREWQKAAHNKCLQWFDADENQKHFVINAAPGAGKTICASVIAQSLLRMGKIERVIIVAPRAEVVRQWSDEFFAVTHRHMTKVTGADAQIEDFGDDLCATWSAVQTLSDGFQSVCRTHKTLVVCDEHHHAAVQAAWGTSANSAFEAASYVLILTGTPVRSDGEETVWLACDSNGTLQHPEEGTYTLTYGAAVDLGYCRPTTFHRHEGKFNVVVDNNEQIEVSGTKDVAIPKENPASTALKSALEFYKVVCTPKFQKDGCTPDMNSYHASMVRWGINKLDDVRHTLPSAGGLVIAPTISMAEYFCDIIQQLDGERPTLVHSQMPNADQKIAAFRRSTKKWIVSVAMISEGVDIRRLRVLIYLPHSQTELSFRQAIGRVVRNNSNNDTSRAYVIMPTHKIFEVFARRVEEEMSPAAKKDMRPSSKKCPICEAENTLNAKYCNECDHEFAKSKTQFFECDVCGHLNPSGAKSCHDCGNEFGHVFEITLKEALRHGVIARGMDINENETQFSEKISPSMRADILSSGDDVLIQLMARLPVEATGRLIKIASKYDR